MILWYLVLPLLEIARHLRKRRSSMASAILTQQLLMVLNREVAPHAEVRKVVATLLLRKKRLERL